MLVLLVVAGLGAAQVGGAGVPGVSGGPWGAWLATTLEGGLTEWAFVGGPTDIEFTSDNRPVIQYHVDNADNEKEVHLQVRTATGWNEVAFPAGPTSDGSLALGAGDTPHVVYRNLSGSTSTTEYARVTDGGGFVIEQVAELNAANTDIELNASGAPRVSYWGADNLRYSWRNASGWQTMKIDAGGYNNGLALDSEDNPHVAYQRNSGDVWYGNNTGDGWVLEKAVELCGFVVDIALDSQDRPHIACTREDEGMTHNWKDTSGWHSEVVDDGSHSLVPRDPNKLAYASIALDGEDRPHIAYTYEVNLASPRTSPGHPHYATKVAGEWVVEGVDHDGQVNGLDMDIALDEEGRPHLSYYLGSRFTFGGGFPYSGNVQSTWDLRYARPAVGEAGVTADAAAGWNPDPGDVNPTVSPQTGEDGWYGASAEAADRDASVRARAVTEGVNASVSEETPSPFLRVPCGEDCEVGVDIPHWSVSAGGGDVGVVVDVDVGGQRKGVVVGVPGVGATLP